jgi:hypothetical protein
MRLPVRLRLVIEAVRLGTAILLPQVMVIRARLLLQAALSVGAGSVAGLVAAAVLRRVQAAAAADTVMAAEEGPRRVRAVGMVMAEAEAEEAEAEAEAR